MDYKKSKAPTNTVTHNLMDLEETFENREQIEISRYYEKLPKPTLIAANEFLHHNIYFRNPAKDKDNLSSES